MNKTHRGFATLTAVTMLAFVGAAMLAIATLAAADSRRSLAVEQDTQLRQLLLAGGMAVKDRAESWGDTPTPEDFDLPLPADLGGERGSVRVRLVPGQDLTARIEARYMDRRAEQVLRLARTDGKWRITSAALNPPQ